MLFTRLLPCSGLFALAANAQETSSASTSAAASQTILTGLSEVATPTGSYLSYSSTITISSSALTTSAIVSTFTSGRSTETTTLGSTTIFGLSTMVGNATNATATSSSTDSRTLLQGSSRFRSSTAPLNGTAVSNSTATSSSSSVQPTNTTPCNNYAQFCGRKYGNITEVAAHNSPFVRAGNAAANQALPVITQLNDGIRLVQGQMHFVNTTPHFCHTSCDVLDAGPITDFLGDVYSWVSTHPYDVVTILLGNGAGSDGVYPLVEQYVPFIESTGLVQYAYEPPKIPMGINDWPTLSSMILTGKRVVFFMDYNANQTAVPWILDEFSQVWETPYDPTDRAFPCTQQRPPGLSTADAEDRLYLMNHNLNYEISLLGNSLLVPNIPLLNVTNNVTGNGSLGVSTTNCVSDWNYPPKFLNVDYYNVGNGSVFDVAAKWNNVTYNRPCCGVAVSGAAKTTAFVGRSALFVAVAAAMLSWVL